MSITTDGAQSGARRIRKQLSKPAGCVRWGFQLSSVELTPGELRTMITGIAPDTPSAASGFLPNDVIESVNGQSLLNVPFDRVKQAFTERFLDIVCVRDDPALAAASSAASSDMSGNINTNLDLTRALARAYLSRAESPAPPQPQSASSSTPTQRVTRRTRPRLSEPPISISRAPEPIVAAPRLTEPATTPGPTAAGRQRPSRLPRTARRTRASTGSVQAEKRTIEVIDLVSDDEEPRTVTRTPAQHTTSMPHNHATKRIKMERQFEPAQIGSQEVVEVAVEMAIASAQRDVDESNADEGEDDVTIVGSTAVFAASMPHARDACPIHPFRRIAAETNRDMCDHCFCFICQIRASECENWLVHCHASHHALKFKACQQLRNGQSIKYLKQRAPYAESSLRACEDVLLSNVRLTEAECDENVARATMDHFCRYVLTMSLRIALSDADRGDGRKSEAVGIIAVKLTATVRAAALFKPPIEQLREFLLPLLSPLATLLFSEIFPHALRTAIESDLTQPQHLRPIQPVAQLLAQGFEAPIFQKLDTIARMSVASIMKTPLSRQLPSLKSLEPEYQEIIATAMARTGRWETLAVLACLVGMKNVATEAWLQTHHAAEAIRFAGELCNPAELTKKLRDFPSRLAALRTLCRNLDFNEKLVAAAVLQLAWDIVVEDTPHTQPIKISAALGNIPVELIELLDGDACLLVTSTWNRAHQKQAALKLLSMAICYRARTNQRPVIEQFLRQTKQPISPADNSKTLFLAELMRVTTDPAALSLIGNVIFTDAPQCLEKTHLSAVFPDAMLEKWMWPASAPLGAMVWHQQLRATIVPLAPTAAVELARLCERQGQFVTGFRVIWAAVMHQLHVDVHTANLFGERNVRSFLSQTQIERVARGLVKQGLYMDGIGVGEAAVDGLVVWLSRAFNSLRNLDDFVQGPEERRAMQLAELQTTARVTGLWPVFLRFLKAREPHNWNHVLDLVSGECKVFEALGSRQAASALQKLPAHIWAILDDVVIVAISERLLQVADVLCQNSPKVGHAVALVFEQLHIRELPNAPQTVARFVERSRCLEVVTFLRRRLSGAHYSALQIQLAPLFPMFDSPKSRLIAATLFGHQQALLEAEWSSALLAAVASLVQSDAEYQIMLPIVRRMSSQPGFVELSEEEVGDDDPMLSDWRALVLLYLIQPSEKRYSRLRAQFDSGFGTDDSMFVCYEIAGWVLEMLPHRQIRPSAFIQLACDSKDEKRAFELLCSTTDWDNNDFAAIQREISKESLPADLFGRWLTNLVLKAPPDLQPMIIEVATQIARPNGIGVELEALRRGRPSNRHITDALNDVITITPTRRTHLPVVLELLVAPDQTTIDRVVQSQDPDVQAMLHSGELVNRLLLNSATQEQGVQLCARLKAWGKLNDFLCSLNNCELSVAAYRMLLTCLTTADMQGPFENTFLAQCTRWFLHQWRMRSENAAFEHCDITMMKLLGALPQRKAYFGLLVIPAMLPLQILTRISGLTGDDSVNIEPFLEILRNEPLPVQYKLKLLAQCLMLPATVPPSTLLEQVLLHGAVGNVWEICAQASGAMSRRIREDIIWAMRHVHESRAIVAESLMQAVAKNSAVLDSSDVIVVMRAFKDFAKELQDVYIGSCIISGDLLTGSALVLLATLSAQPQDSVRAKFATACVLRSIRISANDEKRWNTHVQAITIAWLPVAAKMIDALVTPSAALSVELRRLTMLDKVLTDITIKRAELIFELDGALQFIACWASPSFLGSPRILSHGAYFMNLWETLAAAELTATTSAVPVRPHWEKMAEDATRCFPATGLTAQEFGKAVICKALWLLLQECKLPGTGRSKKEFCLRCLQKAQELLQGLPGGTRVMAVVSQEFYNTAAGASDIEEVSPTKVVSDLLEPFNSLAVDRQENMPRLQAGACSRRAFSYLCDQHNTLAAQPPLLQHQVPVGLWLAGEVHSRDQITHRKMLQMHAPGAQMLVMQMERQCCKDDTRYGTLFAWSVS